MSIRYLAMDATRVARLAPFQDLTPAQQSMLARMLNEVRAPAGATLVSEGDYGYEFMILEEGMDWTNTQINPDDAQFLATRQFQVLEIARLYGLPPHKIGDYSQSHQTNIENANLDYLTTYCPWMAVLPTCDETAARAAGAMLFNRSR